MGLDQYAYRVRKGIIKPGTDINKLDIPSEELEKIAYWRKHPNLHGWMERLYVDKGGEDMFNCEFVQLNEDELVKLQEDILMDALDEAVGPFWGDDADNQYRKSDLDFIKVALDSINKGYDILYYSWW